MATLCFLEWKDEELGHMKSFRLVDEVSHRWNDFGIYLGYNAGWLQSCKTQHLGDSKLIWKEVMQCWLTDDGTHKYPATWEGLYSLLDDLQLGQISAQLRKAVSKCANN